MRLLQIVPTLGRHCGLSVLAGGLSERLADAGVESALVCDPIPGVSLEGRYDAALLWFHSDLLTAADVRRVRAQVAAPLAVFAHSPGVEAAVDAVDGVLALTPALVPDGAARGHVFVHPATVYPFDERVALRARFGLPVERRVLGTSGFLRFERQFDALAQRLVPLAERAGWFVHMAISPWHTESPGVVERLTALRARHADAFGFEYRHLEERELNARLQACDLLWCWTEAPSAAYGSGVVSTHYASGTRMFVTDKLQHEPVLGFPNVVRAPTDLDAFVAALVEQAVSSGAERHDPSRVAWDVVMPELVGWLDALATTSRGPRTAASVDARPRPRLPAV